MTRVAILGLGLIGGSLGLALRQVPGWEVVGYSRRSETVSRALDRGAIGEGAASPQQAVAEARLVVLATHVREMPRLMLQIAPALKPGAVVSDVGSTKVQVLGWARAHLSGVDFIGGHPMAGKEVQGIEEADAGLFRGAVYCLVPPLGARASALARVRKMATAVGALPLVLEAGEHDYLVAGISHLPRLVAVALMLANSRDPAWSRLSRLAAGGFRDTTRLASDSVEMGRDFSLTNRGPLLHWLDRFVAELESLRHMVALGDVELEKALGEAKLARDRLRKKKGW